MKLKLEFFGKNGDYMKMTKAEIAATVEELTSEERAYMSACIKVKQLIEDESFRQRVSDEYKSMQAGNGLSSDEFLELHDRLSDKGL